MGLLYETPCIFIISSKYFDAKLHEFAAKIGFFQYIDLDKGGNRGIFDTKVYKIY